jgi:hypothetical protein
MVARDAREILACETEFARACSGACLLSQLPRVAVTRPQTFVATTKRSGRRSSQTYTLRGQPSPKSLSRCGHRHPPPCTMATNVAIRPMPVHTSSCPVVCPRPRRRNRTPSLSHRRPASATLEDGAGAGGMHIRRRSIVRTPPHMALTHRASPEHELVHTRCVRSVVLWTAE